ncbi:MAG TPA: TonB-dependent receptor plug domain-containing protein, partial [Nitrosopumilaceae archaeon]|nr:TonB-dependent receptor plug domain-containing protein [Nitrosopumilaceae archaeon]
MKKCFLFFLIVFSFSQAFSQDAPKREVKGTIKDEVTGETLIGATVVFAPGQGVQTDVDGNYSLKLQDGDYVLTFSFVGYGSQTQRIKVKGKDLHIDMKLSATTLTEVEVVADVAKTRETPVAMSNISGKQIQEELGARDLPMMLNSTPGVYATQQGGGAGDARINIRGFDQRYVAVMVDGVPVNDMENGQVYWSNWSGLSEITRSMQVQRGLGASRLAVPSVGGTMNIITQGIDSKPFTTVKKEFGNNNYNRISLAHNTGLINNKFSMVLAASYTTGDGWVDQTYNKTWAYFAKFQYRVNKNHLLTFGANGAPQEHGQKITKLKIPIYDRNYAQAHGANADSVLAS